MSDTTILSAAIVTVGSTVAASMLPHKVNRSPRGVDCVKGELPSFKMLAGQALLFTGIGIGAQGSEKLAATFAVVIAATAFTYYALPVLTMVFSEGGLCKPGTTERQP